MTCIEDGCRYPVFRGKRCYLHAMEKADRDRHVRNALSAARKCKCGAGLDEGEKTCGPCKAAQRRRSRRDYWILRQLGLCTRCGLAPTPLAICAGCRDQRKSRASLSATLRRTERERAQQRKVKAAKPPGECVILYCYEQTDGVRKMCAGCREAANAKNRANRAEGLCRCGAEVEPGYERCAHCREVNLRWRRKRKGRIATMRKRNRRKRQAEGKCRNYRCENPPAEGRKACQECLDDEANAKAQRRQAGLCPNCGLRPPAPERASCHVCLERLRRSAAKQRARRRDARDG